MNNQHAAVPRRRNKGSIKTARVKELISNIRVSFPVWEFIENFHSDFFSTNTDIVNFPGAFGQERTNLLSVTIKILIYRI